MLVKYLLLYKWFWIFFVFFLLFQKMGRSGDGKRNILWGWPNRNKGRNLTGTSTQIPWILPKELNPLKFLSDPTRRFNCFKGNQYKTTVLENKFRKTIFTRFGNLLKTKSYSKLRLKLLWFFAYRPRTSSNFIHGNQRQELELWWYPPSYKKSK